jgi:hypothetical protein
MIRLALAIVTVFLFAVFVAQFRAHNQPNLLIAPNDPSHWYWQQFNHVASGAVSTDGGTLRVDITKVDGDAGNLILYQRAIATNTGRKYHVSFWAKADKTRKIGVTAGRGSWSPGFKNNGLCEEYTIGKEWTPHETTFTVVDADNYPAKLPVFLLGGATGTVWLKDVSVRQAG